MARLAAGEASVKDIADWAGHSRRFWEESFDRLDEYLRESKSDEGKRGRKRGKK